MEFRTLIEEQNRWLKFINAARKRTASASPFRLQPGRPEVRRSYYHEDMPDSWTAQKTRSLACARHLRRGRCPGVAGQDSLKRSSFRGGGPWRLSGIISTLQ